MVLNPLTHRFGIPEPDDKRMKRRDTTPQRSPTGGTYEEQRALDEEARLGSWGYQAGRHAGAVDEGTTYEERKARDEQARLDSWTYQAGRAVPDADRNLLKELLEEYQQPVDTGPTYTPTQYQRPDLGPRQYEAPEFRDIPEYEPIEVDPIYEPPELRDIPEYEEPPRDELDLRTDEELAEMAQRRADLETDPQVRALHRSLDEMRMEADRRRDRLEMERARGMEELGEDATAAQREAAAAARGRGLYGTELGEAAGTRARLQAQQDRARLEESYGMAIAETDRELAMDKRRTRGELEALEARRGELAAQYLDELSMLEREYESQERQRMFDQFIQEQALLSEQEQTHAQLWMSDIERMRVEKDRHWDQWMGYQDLLSRREAQELEAYLAEEDLRQRELDRHFQEWATREQLRAQEAAQRAQAQAPPTVDFGDLAEQAAWGAILEGTPIEELPTGFQHVLGYESPDPAERIISMAQDDPFWAATEESPEERAELVEYYRQLYEGGY